MLLQSSNSTTHHWLYMAFLLVVDEREELPKGNGVKLNLVQRLMFFIQPLPLVNQAKLVPLQTRLLHNHLSHTRVLSHTAIFCLNHILLVLVPLTHRHSHLFQHHIHIQYHLAVFNLHHASLALVFSHCGNTKPDYQYPSIFSWIILFHSSTLYKSILFALHTRKHKNVPGLPYVTAHSGWLCSQPTI